MNLKTHRSVYSYSCLLILVAMGSSETRCGLPSTDEGHDTSRSYIINIGNDTADTSSSTGVVNGPQKKANETCDPNQANECESNLCVTIANTGTSVCVTDCTNDPSLCTYPSTCLSTDSSGVKFCTPTGGDNGQIGTSENSTQNNNQSNTSTSNQNNTGNTSSNSLGDLGKMCSGSCDCGLDGLGQQLACASINGAGGICTRPCDCNNPCPSGSRCSQGICML